MEMDSVAIKKQIIQSEIEHLQRKLTAKEIEMDAILVLEGWYEQIDSQEFE